MSALDKARQTQLKNIETKTGLTLDQVRSRIRQSGLVKHSELRAMLMETLKLGYGDANSLVHFAQESDGQSASAGLSDSDVLHQIYVGPKAHLRPLHDRLMGAIHEFGGDFEIAPKKGYVSLRRKKQFAMIGPATSSEIEVGLNVKSLPADPRLKAMPPKGMCQYKVRLSDFKEVDVDLLRWLKLAWDGAQ